MMFLCYALVLRFLHDKGMDKFSMYNIGKQLKLKGENHRI